MELILVGLLIWGGVKLYRRYRARPHDDSGAQSSAGTTDVPTFRVVSLGTSGAGKTVFLASMFHELTVRRQGRPFTLEAGAAQRNELGAVYTEVLDSTGTWPRGTRVGEEREFTFECVAKTETSRHNLFNISYLDYAGELLQSNTRPEEVAKLEVHVKQAHALFGMLDGRRLAQYLRGEPEGATYLHGEILPMVGLLAASSCPIHFIVTKWDIVEDIGEGPMATDETRLAIVKKALLAHVDIASLIRGSTPAHRTVRLIPVSAIGDGFATLDEAGTVSKIPGATIGSKNLDVPFAAVLPDHFSQIEARLTEADRETVRARSAEGSTRTKIQKTLNALSAAAQMAIRQTVPQPDRFALSATTELIFAWIARPLDSQADRVSDDNKLTADELGSRSRAQDAVLDSLEKSVWMLEAEVPSSILQHGLAR